MTGYNFNSDALWRSLDRGYSLIRHRYKFLNISKDGHLILEQGRENEVFMFGPTPKRYGRGCVDYRNLPAIVIVYCPPARSSQILGTKFAGGAYVPTLLSGCMRPSACRCHHSILSMAKIEPSFQR